MNEKSLLLDPTAAGKSTPGEALKERTRERVRVTPSQATTEVFRNE